MSDQNTTILTGTNVKKQAICRALCDISLFYYPLLTFC